MANARLSVCFSLLALLISFQLSTSVDPPTEPPLPESDAPGSPTSTQSPSPPAPPPDSSSSPGPSPSLPPADGDGDEDPSPSPSPSPDYGPEADAPAPEADEWTNVKSGMKPVKNEEEGMSGGKKAGIVIGVFAFVGLAALCGFVYKKRKENMERAAFGAAVRREFL